MAVGDFVSLARMSLVNEPLLANSAITGELSKLTLARSGHSYFALTDSKGSIDCVLFGGNQSFEQQDIKVGQIIIALGGIDVYVKTGRMQFKASRIQPVESIGQLEKSRKALIEKWRVDGTMDRARTPIPQIPKRLVIITGAGSAALSDMQRLIDNRWPNFAYSIIPVLVQGEQAAGQIIAAIAQAQSISDLIIVGRGGGSPEDLWAFNLESVCRAIIDSKIPVVSAIGHESDLMVSDLIADLRASTPSNAVERVVPIKQDLVDEISMVGDRIDFALDRFLQSQHQQIQKLRLQLAAGPMRGLNKEKLRLNLLNTKMDKAVDLIFGTQKNRLAGYSSLLISTNPKRVLERGYSMTLDLKGKPVTSIAGLKQGDPLTVVLKDGQVETEVK
ncbi:MAG: exodeoxyribonuclease VII large subunit [Candidatus Poseidoniales archaeon]